jgi:hypothetical protein
MTILHHVPRTINRIEPPRPAFVTAAGVYRRSAQGDVRRCTALDLALLSMSAAVIWRLEAHRQKQEG